MVSHKHSLAAALFLGTCTAQLLANPLVRPASTKDHEYHEDHHEDHGYKGDYKPASSSLGDGPQQRLNTAEPQSNLPPFKAGQFTLTPQGNDTCATYGEDQWTGTIDVTDERRLFFWYFDSRNDPENDPVIIWLNGGPGGSSMMGLFNELGPCWLDPGASDTVPNDFAWNNNASLLFLDQPAGVGFSSLAEGSPLPGADMDGAQDFQTFLDVFFADVFPSKAHLPIHLAAESYGGHYAPTYLDHILTSRAYDSPSAFRGDIESLILVNAVIDFAAPSVGAYELLCSDYRGGGIVNATACESIHRDAVECESLGRSCALSYDPHECFAMVTFCQDRIDAWYWEQVELGLRNPYNIGIGCPHNFPSCDDERKGNFTAYLNQPRILEALRFPAGFTFDNVNMAINEAYTGSDTPWKPTTREVSAVLAAGVRVLVLNGNEDYVVNTPGNAWAYDNLLWDGHAEFRIAPWGPLPEDVSAATGFWKGTRDGRLVFVGVDGGGHTVPGDVREGSAQILQRWIEGRWSA